MTHIKDARPEPLTAEREAALREWGSGVNWPDTPTTRWWQRDVAQLFATLDAARAETEAVRSLAAELVEGLKLARVAVVTWSPNPTEPLDVINAALARARALGIGEEKNATKDGRTE